MDMRLEILGAVLELGVLLLRKNAGYGNSAADPLMVFSRLDAVERLGVRMDDKLSRIARGREDGQEDTRGDLAGYLVLDGIVRGMRDGAEPREVGDVLALWGEALGHAGLLVEVEKSSPQRHGGTEGEREEEEGVEEEELNHGDTGSTGEEGMEGEEIRVVGGVDGEPCYRVPVSFWERTLAKAEQADALESERDALLAVSTTDH